MKIIGTIFILIFLSAIANAEDGHKLWLRNTSTATVEITCTKSSPTISIAIDELKNGWQGKNGATINLKIEKHDEIQGDGFKISKSEIQANTEFGILYGVYEYLRRQQTGQPIGEEISNPSYEVRILNHWDGVDTSYIPGFASRSIFWRRGENALEVTEADKTLWREYARANASIGINATVPNIVNASPIIITKEYLERVKAIADVLRPYGVKTYLAVNFSSPKIIGGLNTSDPLNPKVKDWWKERVKEIYELIPDFGGFVIKANSEGEPGPQDFGRTHADGANTLADALGPFGGIVMWRAFVYNPIDKDRAKQAYNEFMPLDGKFRDNVIVQVKNGPIDFQPREPFSPLFGAMKKTSIMPEFQIVQEYLGGTIHLVYLAPMWEECLKSETYQEGPGSTVASCTDGSLLPQKHTAISAVANIYSDTNWCGHTFAQSNWYAFGRLAWDNTLTSEKIADEWVKLTFYDPSSSKAETQKFSSDWKNSFLIPIKYMMLQSREAAVNYMMPLGFHHIFAAASHYGPGPWWSPENMRPDWTPPYYHQAEENGVGFDRTHEGSDAVSQYHEPLASQLNDVNTCPEEYLLWFHHLPWDHGMKSGRTLWDEICYHYDTGLNQVQEFQKIWDKAETYIDKERFTLVQKKLRSQVENAQVWKDACLLYFQQFSQMPIPYDINRPVHNLEDLIQKDLSRPELSTYTYK